MQNIAKCKQLDFDSFMLRAGLVEYSYQDLTVYLSY